MKMNKIPGTDIDVSAVSLGTMTFGNPVDRDAAVRMVHWALDHGINFMDTADIYEGYDRQMGSPGGVGEQILGVALKDRRERAVITTKVGNPVGGGGYEGTGLGRPHMVHQLEASLRRLQTDCVDFYELHKPDPEVPLAESIGVMIEMMGAGKVRHWGFSNFGATGIRDMLRVCEENGWPGPVINQSHYNWLVRDEEEEALPLCRENGIAVTPYRGLECGLLCGKYHRDNPPPPGSRITENPAWMHALGGAGQIPAEVFDRLERYEGEAAAAGLSPSQYAVRWLLDQDGVTSVVVGVKRLDQLEEIVRGIES